MYPALAPCIPFFLALVALKSILFLILIGAEQVAGRRSRGPARSATGAVLRSGGLEIDGPAFGAEAGKTSAYAVYAILRAKFGPCPDSHGKKTDGAVEYDAEPPGGADGREEASGDHGTIQPQLGAAARGYGRSTCDRR